MKSLFTFLLATLVSLAAFAQDDSPRFIELALNDGSVKTGELLEVTAEYFLIFVEPIGEMRVPKYQIASMEYVDKPTALGEWDYTEYAYSNQYFLTSSAIPNKKGQSSVRITAVGLSFSSALSDNLSITGSTSWIGAPLVGNLRYSHQLSEGFYGSIGMTIGTLGFYNLSAGGFMPNARITFGDRAHNVSAGYGIACVQGDDDPGWANVWTAGTSLKISSQFSFVAELIYVFEAERSDSYSGEKNFGINTLGVRWHNKPGSMWQIGFAGMFQTYTRDHYDYEYNPQTGYYDSEYQGSSRETEWVPVPLPAVSWTKSF